MRTSFLWMAVLFFAVAVKAEPIGLVLSGGGAKGSYEVGVWKAICELGLQSRITAFSGTSVGGLNAALFSVVGEPDECERIWRDSLSRAFVCNTNVVRDALQKHLNEVDADLSDKEEVTKHDLMGALAKTALRGVLRGAESVLNATGGTKETVGVCDSSQLRKMLHSALSPYDMSKIPAVYVTAVPKAKTGKVEFALKGLSLDGAIERLMATAAIPTVYDAVNIDGTLYVDGSFEAHGGDNVPIDPIRKNHPEIATIIVVCLKSEAKLDKRLTGLDCTNCRVVEITPSRDIGGGFLGWEGVFDTSDLTCSQLVDLGYRDACKALRDL